jgi:hypothetical protein
MHDISLLRLYILRAMYVLLIVGVGSMIWPLLLDAPTEAEHFRGVTWCLLSTVAILAVFGLRYPVKMIPVLLFELVWKVTWLVAIGLPLRQAGPLQADFADTWFANVFGLVVLVVVLPWGYIARTYFRESGDRWVPARRAAHNVEPALPG